MRKSEQPATVEGFQEVERGLREEREQWQRSAREQINITRQTAVERDHYRAEAKRLRKALRRIEAMDYDPLHHESPRTIAREALRDG